MFNDFPLVTIDLWKGQAPAKNFKSMKIQAVVLLLNQ